TGVRQIFKALKQGETTVILPDHTPNVGGDMINYFGVPLASSNLSAKLIQKTKAKALFLYAIRNEHDGFTMHIEPMDEKIYEGSADDGTFVIHQAIEQLIQHYPEHYHWSYKRFKANPALDNIYNIDPNEALQIVDRLKAEASQTPVKPNTLETSSV
ncbi:lysophospholipid acyltransferase family protein, partial [Acinetobacter sp. A11]